MFRTARACRARPRSVLALKVQLKNFHVEKEDSRTNPEQTTSENVA